MKRLVRKFSLGVTLVLWFLGQAQAQEPARGAESFRRAEAALKAGDAWAARGLFERAIHEGFPRAAGYRALAEAYLALDHRLFDAREALESSLAADSTDVATWHRLAEVNLLLGGMDAENRARRALRQVLRLDPEHEDAFDRWRRLYLDRKDAHRVAEILGSHLDREYRPQLALWRIDVLHEVGAHDEALRDLERFDHQVGGEESSEWLHYMSATLTALGRDAEAWRYYRQGIDQAPEEADLDRYFRDVEPLLPENDRGAWSGWSLSARKGYLEGWWNRRDPLPLNELNERWVEQQRRIRVAREFFQYRRPMARDRLSALQSPNLVGPRLGFRLDGRAMDDRAELYLRHGDPDMKAGVGMHECGFWYYRREGLPEGKSFGVNFVRRILGNDCVFSRNPLTPMGRYHFDPSGFGELDPLGVILDIDSELSLALGSDSYPYEIAERIPLDVAPANFSHLAGATELSLYFSVPTEAVAAGTDRARYRKGLVVYDEQWKEITRQTEEMAYDLGPVGAADAPGTAFLIDLFRLQIRPGEYHLAIQVDDRNGEGIGVWKGPISVREFRPGRLQLSDIVLAGSVESQGLARFIRYGNAVLPLPSRTVVRGQRFFLYYEIYNLRAEADGQSKFRVEYAIQAERLDRGLVGRLFQGLAGLVGVREEPEGVVIAFDRQRRSGGRLWPEVLSFDTRELPPGTYRVAVTVIDRLAGDAQARQAVELSIVD
jgi:tetratricopeptide (TPR) repeat protein